MVRPHIAPKGPAAGDLPTANGKPISWQPIAILLGRVRLIGQETFRAFRLDQSELANRIMGQ